MDQFTQDDLHCIVCRSGSLQGSHANCGDSDRLWCGTCGAAFPVIDGIPSIVAPDSPLAQAASAETGTCDSVLQARYWSDTSHGFRRPTHPIVRSFARQRWNVIARCIDMDGVRTALDVGCGAGFSTLGLPEQIRATGCDGSRMMLASNSLERKLQCDATRLPFADDTFDLVFAWELLHHVETPAQVLSEMRRVSRRYVVSFEPNPLNPAQAGFAAVDRAHRWVFRYSRRYLRQNFRAAGLRVLGQHTGGYIFPNKTPQWLFHAVRRMPWKLPWLGISTLTIAEAPRSVVLKSTSGSRDARAA